MMPEKDLQIMTFTTINMKKILLPFLLSLIFQLSSHSQCSGDIAYTLDTPPSSDLTYPPNTDVVLCVTMTGWNPLDANWFEGFGLSLGLGWESVVPVTSPLDVGVDAIGAGNWIWMDNVTSSATQLFAGPGYFFENTGGGGGGIVDGNSGNDWGDNCIGLDCTWQFCVLLTSSSTSGDDLNIQITPYADGTMGGYGSNGSENNCFDPPVSIFDGEVGCTVYGCINPIACNFNPLAGCDDGSCDLPGCTDPTACNYDLNAECDDGSCTYGGCTNPNACNFNPLAGCDDGTCNYFSMGDITHNLIPCPDTVCTGLEVNYAVTGNQSSFYDWHVTGGGLVTIDQTNDCEIIWGDIPGTYTITVQEITEQGCIGDIKTCDVEVIVPDITFDTSQYKMCLNGSVRLNAEPLGGEWISNDMNGNTFLGTSPGTYYPSYITNIHGCDIQEEVEVIVKRKYEAPDIIYSSELIDFCNDSYNQNYAADDSIGVTYSWFIDDVRQLTTDNQLSVQWYDTTQTYILKVIAYDEIGCESEPKLISVRTETCQRFFAPNSFTPNGDGINDVFMISGLSVYQPNLKIFNRWGVEVYVSSNLWWTGDGGGGYYCDNGAYNWIIEYRDKLGQNKQESGHVILVR